MVDLMALASTAVGLLGDSLLDAGKNVVSDAAKAAGGKVSEWLKGKLAGNPDAGALAKFEENPQSQGAKRRLEGALLERLEQDETLVQELGKLLAEAGDHSVNQTLEQIGIGNVGVQISGSSNEVKLGKKD